MNLTPVFDLAHYSPLNAARAEVLRPLLTGLRKVPGVRSALDVGCGSGYFSSVLREEGFQAVGLDGRQENVTLAAERHPGIAFHIANVEEAEVRRYGPVDLVLCLGLLYHLENPFQAIRNLFELTGQILIVESMCVPGEGSVMELRDEGATADQGLRYVAFYPSEPCLIKMLYRAGFPHVFRFARLPEHEDFHGSAVKKRMRTMLAASKVELQAHSLEAIAEPSTPADSWATPWAEVVTPFARLRRLFSKPWPEKLAAVRRHIF